MLGAPLASSVDHSARALYVSPTLRTPRTPPAPRAAPTSPAPRAATPAPTSPAPRAAAAAPTLRRHHVRPCLHLRRRPHACTSRRHSAGPHSRRLAPPDHIITQVYARLPCLRPALRRPLHLPFQRVLWPSRRWTISTPWRPILRVAFECLGWSTSPPCPSCPKPTVELLPIPIGVQLWWRNMMLSCRIIPAPYGGQCRHREVDLQAQVPGKWVS